MDGYMGKGGGGGGVWCLFHFIGISQILLDPCFKCCGRRGSMSREIRGRVLVGWS